MDDDGVNAPVTRLRRRLSVERSDDVKSPAPATPTKKRGGRLAAKPQLELIDENATNGSAKRSTRKASAKELVEEEKPATPSRRSTRIKSNTSIISETTQAFDSPRAKRAARRTSQVGSDSELPLTPARQTRRTRKDSTSTIDKQETALSTKPNNITDIIIEEADSVSVKSDNTQETATDNKERTSLRKSPRLSGKKSKENSLDQKNNIIIHDKLDGTLNNTINDLNISKQTDNTSPLNNASLQYSSENENTDSIKESLTNISIDIVQELDKNSRKKPIVLNKSTPALGDSNNCKNQRQRTKSLTAENLSENSEGGFYSDNESTKKKIKLVRKSIETHKPLVGSSNNENAEIESSNLSQDNENTKQIIEKSETKITFSTKKKKKTETSYVSDSLQLENDFSSPNKSNMIKTSEAISPQGNKENIHVIVTQNITTTNILAKAPCATLQSTIFYEDSDSEVKGQPRNIQPELEDQCVPIVDNPLQNEENLPVNEEGVNEEKIDSNMSLKEVLSKSDSCEPMDIDVTIPNNITSTNISKPNILNKSSENINDETIDQKSFINFEQVDKSLTKSQCKSSNSSSQNLEKTQNENKSTLILSQIKDSSSAETSVSKSPKPSKEVLSKSVNTLGLVHKIKDKKNMSLDYSTSTPLQQKRVQKLGMQINTSVIDTSNTERKCVKQDENDSKNKISRISDGSDSSESESEESIKSNNDLLDDEADIANENYESGESLDEDERKYEEENEIIEKGETLDSEDEVSTDTDYEKDSFIVSSDEEDDNLLSGSGDDLSMSDNELTMSKKSKKKYDDRKAKEQKRASKEMYAARHNLDESDNKSNSKKIKNKKIMKIESDSSESEKEVTKPIKKKRPGRLDSTHDESHNESKADKSTSKMEKRSLCESMSELNTNKEPEISTRFDESISEKDDPLSQAEVKQEPKTPMKSLNISTVKINQDIEQIEVDNNVSITKPKQIIDPLEATMAEESMSSISENSEIIKNYDSVLKNLNVEDDNKKVKSFDISLNINKKVKQSKKEAIVDQLNLTQIKTPKKNKKAAAKDTDDAKLQKPRKNEIQKPTNNDDESSSDSIDLQLLFSEDSDELDQNTRQKKQSDDSELEEDYIPLKKTPGKTNILSNEDTEETTRNTSLNESRNTKSFSKSPITSIDDNNCYDLHDIVDTHGTRPNILHNESITRGINKNKRTSIEINLHVAALNDADDDAPEEISYKSNRNEKKNRKSSMTDHEISILNESGNNKSNTNDVYFIIDTEGNTEANVSFNKSLNTSSKTKKKKKYSLELDNSHFYSDNNSATKDHNMSLESSKKLKKLRETDNMSHQQLQVEDDVCTESNYPLKFGTEVKKMNKVTMCCDEQTDTTKVNDSLNISLSKKKIKESPIELDASLKSITNTSMNNANKQKSVPVVTEDQSTVTEIDISGSKKRKRSIAGEEINEGDNRIYNTSEGNNKSFSMGSKKKKRKISQNEHIQNEVKGDVKQNSEIIFTNHTGEKAISLPKDGVFRKMNKKRKNRDDDEGNSATKVLKDNSLGRIHVPRLPASFLDQLEEKPMKAMLKMKKSAIISTSSFVVEEMIKRKNKPSNFLEESVYLNDTHIEKKQKGNIEKPKVLPYVPTAETSGSGFTTNFKINIIPQEVQFVAQTKTVTNFKNDYLYRKRNRRTNEGFKKPRAKMSKF